MIYGCGGDLEDHKMEHHCDELGMMLDLDLVFVIL